MAQHLQQQQRPVAVLHMAGRHDDREEEAKRIDEKMALAPFDLLGCVIAADPPFSVVFTV